MFDSINSIFEKDNIGTWYNFIYTLPSKENTLPSKENINISVLKNKERTNILLKKENNLLLANDYNFKKAIF